MLPQNGIDDEDEVRLAEWAAATIRIKAFLKEMPQDFWMDVTGRMQAGDQDVLLLWMLDQAECDFSIAQRILLDRAPHRLRNRIPVDTSRQQLDPLTRVLVNWEKGFYRLHEIAQPERDLRTQLRRLTRALDVVPAALHVFEIPAEFLRAGGGRQPRIPPDLSPDTDPGLWQLYSALGLEVTPGAPGAERERLEALRRPNATQRVARRVGRGILRWPHLAYCAMQKPFFEDDAALRDWIDLWYSDPDRWRQELADRKAAARTWPGAPGHDVPQLGGNKTFCLTVCAGALIVAIVYEFMLT